MKEKQHIFWSNGIISSIGELVKIESLTVDSVKYHVKNPATITFYTDSRQDENGMQVSTLKADVTPYVFSAIISKGDNIWTVKNPECVMCDDNTLSEEIIKTYEAAIAVTSKKTK